MFEQTLTHAHPVEDLSTRALLEFARTQQRAARQAEVGILRAALQWAVAHPSQDGTADADDAAAFFGAAGAEAIAGQGVPGVAEFAIAELGSELGISTTAAKRLVGHAQELAHRLPRLWRRVLAGDVDPWRARRVAEATIHAFPRLPVEAATWVDAQVAPFAQKVGQAQVDRLVDEALRRWRLSTPVDPDDPDEGNRDRRHVTIHPEQVAFDGTTEVTATLGLADALDLEHALATTARELKELGSTESLDIRRATALGEMARRQTSLDLAGASGVADAEPGQRPAVARRLDLHLHFSAALTGAGHPTGAGDGSGREQLDVAPTGLLDQGQRLVLLEQVQQWCRDSRTEVRILPVIDLNTEIECDGYVPAPRLRRQVQLRDRTCVFPWCSRPARSCDLDHVVPYVGEDVGDGPAETRTSNLATLCRSHHRLKTRTSWRLEVVGAGAFVWTSPHGHRYRRDRSGTARLDATAESDGLNAVPQVPLPRTPVAMTPAGHQPRSLLTLNLTPGVR